MRRIVAPAFVFPAHAGMTRFGCCAGRRRRSVPRPRGDDPDRWDGTRCPVPPRVPRPRGDDPPKIPPLDRAIVLVLFQAGLRRSEAAALEWRDVVPAATGPPLRVAALLPIPAPCGGTSFAVGALSSIAGLSPRMRGNLYLPQ